MQSAISIRNLELTFSDTDIVNPDEFIPAGEYNPNNVHPWLLHDHGFLVAVVFAENLQDALDIAVDANKLDRFQIHPEDESEREDYLTEDFAKADSGLDPECPEYVSPDGKRYWWRYMPALLGNASEPFDIESLGYVELRNPAFSFCALWDNAFRSGGGVISSHFA